MLTFFYSRYVYVDMKATPDVGNNPNSKKSKTNQPLITLMKFNSAAIKGLSLLNCYRVL